MTKLTQDYCGRFAPSPTGPLHFGSLVAALASYLEAKSTNGQWLVRIEDLDPPREVPGAATQILKTLESFRLHWDGEVVYQSQRLNHYSARLEQLVEQQAVYACRCSRKQIRELGGGQYQGTCRDKALSIQADRAIRVRQSPLFGGFDDGIQGTIRCLSGHDEDFVIKRRDGLFAYHLAVVVDDIEQEITHVVRGSDIITSTPQHLRLYQLFSHPPPKYCHIPLAVDHNGQKLSKQNYAPAITISKAGEQLVNALEFLGQMPDRQLKYEKQEAILEWSIKNWDISLVPGHQTIEIID